MENVYNLKHVGEIIDKVVENNSLDKIIRLNASGDYYYFVIPLIKMENNETFIGDITIVRESEIYAPVRVFLNVFKPWEQNKFVANNLVISSHDKCRLCTFTYNGEKYMGINWFENAYPDKIFVRYSVGREPAIMDYKYRTEVLNQEINDSIINFYWNDTSIE